MRVLHLLATVLALALCVPAVHAADAAKSSARVLFILTSHARLGDTGKPTGFFLSELTHPLAVLEQAGHRIDIASVKGGKAPVDGFDLEDPVNKAFWNNPEKRQAIENTPALSGIDPSAYDAVVVPGGHGTMWDLPDNPDVIRILGDVHARGGIVAAICHGPAALVNVKKPDGTNLVAGQRVAAFTNAEEKAVQLEKVVPFLLADKLVERGAIHEPGPDFAEKVVVSGRLVTGQNPASGTALGRAIAGLLAGTTPAAP